VGHITQLRGRKKEEKRIIRNQIKKKGKEKKHFNPKQASYSKMMRNPPIK